MVVLTTHIDTLDRQWDGADILKSERRLPKVVAPPGKFRGIAFLKHPNIIETGDSL